MTERVDILIVGAGPAGLRAAQVLAEAGRHVVVAERQSIVGPKTCAGGLSEKAVRELTRLGLPRELGRTTLGTISFRGGPAQEIDPAYGVVRTISRARLGSLQERWARAAGAEILTGCPVSELDLAAKRVRLGKRTLRYDHLIGADGSTSQVRRALGLPSPRAYFAGEFNVPAHHADSLLVAFDSPHLANGYFWIFPHQDYTSFGAGSPVHLVRPAAVRKYLDDKMAALGLADRLPPFEAATIEVTFGGFHFRDDVHLVGDAAGVASGLTGEGIYAALVTGEEVALQILDPARPAPKTQAWMRTKRLHDAVGRAWLRKPVRDASLLGLTAALHIPPLRARATLFFLA